MKILLNEKIFGWKMTGLMGSGGLWFFGFSRAVSPSKEFMRYLKEPPDGSQLDVKNMKKHDAKNGSDVGAIILDFKKGGK